MLEKILGVSAAYAEEAATAAAATGAEGEMVGNPIVALLTTMLPMVLIFVVFWFMLIRPAEKRQAG